MSVSAVPEALLEDIQCRSGAGSNYESVVAVPEALLEESTGWGDTSL